MDTLPVCDSNAVIDHVIDMQLLDLEFLIPPSPKFGLERCVEEAYKVQNLSCFWILIGFADFFNRPVDATV